MMIKVPHELLDGDFVVLENTKVKNVGFLKNINTENQILRLAIMVLFILIIFPGLRIF